MITSSTVMNGYKDLSGPVVGEVGSLTAAQGSSSGAS